MKSEKMFADIMTRPIQTTMRQITSKCPAMELAKKRRDPD